jgi:aryl-alcohol dehydrogenase-like predicted oxidoreductase
LDLSLIVLQWGVAQNGFLESRLGRNGPRVFRLGLSATYRPGKQTIHRAIDEGLNYFFFFGIDNQMTSVLRERISQHRERYVIACGAYNYLWGHQDFRKTLDKRLLQLRTDYIDVFHFLGVTRAHHFPPQLQDELARLKEDGRVRAISMSTHERKFAGSLAAAGKLDSLMIRYNAAHRGAERDIFPHLASHSPGVVSFTATRWRYLLRRPRGWPPGAPIPTAGECYRFVLSNPAVDVCLSAPSNLRQFEANLRAVRQGALDPDHLGYICNFGDAVYGRARRHSFLAFE